MEFYLTVLFLPVSVVNAVETFSFIKRLNIPETYSEPSRTSKMKVFAKIVQGKKPLIVFAKRFYLRCSTGFWIRLYIFLPKNVSYTFMEGSFVRKKLEGWRNESLQMFGETSWDKVSLILKKILDIISLLSLNKKI